MQGFINIYKPSGISSAKAVAIVKKASGSKRVGHMGTLDPMACGVLPIAVNKATKMFDYFLEKEKSYRAIFTFGYETDTLDALGETVLSGGRVPLIGEINECTKKLTGTILQYPPQFSAKSVNGVRAYKLARSGQQVELNPKEVTIFKFDLIKQIDDNSFEFEITCSSGTYIRSLCKDLAKLLNTYATMTFLERTKSGVFTVNNCIKLERIENENFENLLLPIDKVFSKFEVINVSDNQSEKLLYGQTIKFEYNNVEKVFVKHNELLLGLGFVNNNKLKLLIHLKEEKE